MDKTKELQKIARDIFDCDQDWDIYEDFQDWFTQKNPGLTIDKFENLSNRFGPTVYQVRPIDSLPWTGTLFYFSYTNDGEVWAKDMEGMERIF